MHWTALLAYGRSAAPWVDAQVNDDICCVGCGYNLRGLMASGRCPECARRVGQSLMALGMSEAAVRGLRFSGVTFLAPLLLVIMFIVPSPITFALCMAIMLGASALRAIGAAELRTGTSDKMLRVRNRAQWFLYASVLELCLFTFAMLLLVLILVLPLQGPPNMLFVLGVAGSWLMSFASAVFFAAITCMALAEALGNRLLAQRFWIVVGALAGAGLCMMAFVLPFVIPLPADIRVAVMLLLVVMTSGALVSCMVLMMNLASVTDEERGGYDTLLAERRIQRVAPRAASPPPPLESPPISLEP